jgi:hypothetical protein
MWLKVYQIVRVKLTANNIKIIKYIYFTIIFWFQTVNKNKLVTIFQCYILLSIFYLNVYNNRVISRKCLQLDTLKLLY